MTTKIAVLTGGGDCPGLNAVMRAAVRRGIKDHGDELIGSMDGWPGVIDDDCVYTVSELLRRTGISRSVWEQHLRHVIPVRRLNRTACLSPAATGMILSAGNRPIRTQKKPPTVRHTAAAVIRTTRSRPRQPSIRRPTNTRG